MSRRAICSDALPYAMGRDPRPQGQTPPRARWDCRGGCRGTGVVSLGCGSQVLPRVCRGAHVENKRRGDIYAWTPSSG
eukprot:5184745-Pyramimonas_sp.AAC.1